MTLKGLQILRFIACLFVVYCHLKVAKMIGFFSLDIFFLISGFVISLMILRPQQTVAHFIKGRVARVLPLYWGLTIVIFLMAIVAPSLLNSTTANPVNLFKSLFFVPYRKESGLIDPILAVGWTLNIEIMFYVFCALSLMFAVAMRTWFIGACMIGLYLFCNYFHPYTSSAPVEFYSAHYMVVLVLGVIMHQVYVRNRAFFVLPKWPGIALITFLLMLLIYLDYTRDWHLDYQYLLGLTVPSILLILAVLSMEHHIGDGPLVRFAVYMGDASYSIYLTHVFVIEAMRKLLPHLISGFSVISIPGAILTFLACFCVGALLDRFYDKPMVKRASAYFRR